MPQISLSVRPREESGDSLHRREWQFDFWVTLSNDQFWFRGWNDRLESPLTLSNPTVFSVGYGRACLLSKAFVVQSESKLLIYWWYGTWVRAFWRRVWRNELASLKDVLLTHSQCASRRLSWARPWTGLHSTDKFAHPMCTEQWKMKAMEMSFKRRMSPHPQSGMLRSSWQWRRRFLFVDTAVRCSRWIVE